MQSYVKWKMFNCRGRLFYSSQLTWGRQRKSLGVHQYQKTNTTKTNLINQTLNNLVFAENIPRFQRRYVTFATSVVELLLFLLFVICSSASAFALLLIGLFCCIVNNSLPHGFSPIEIWNIMLRAMILISSTAFFFTLHILWNERIKYSFRKYLKSRSPRQKNNSKQQAHKYNCSNWIFLYK